MNALYKATLLFAPIHVTNAGALTFLKATKHHDHAEHVGHADHVDQHEQHHRHKGKYSHTGECWAHRPTRGANFAQLQQTPHSLAHPEMALPGAGMHPDDITPYETVTKDGYLMVACVKDSMLEKGDKFGNNKLSYKYEDVSGVSIVHYQEIIAKEDRETMSVQVCFDFCRTVPNMVFFGLHGGHDCYCEPYYKQVAGDSSNCDLPCYGDPKLMCGGKSKSNIYEMHSCADTKRDLEKAITEVEDTVFFHLHDMIERTERIANSGQSDAVDLQEIFGQAGGPDVSNFMQVAKLHAGDMLDAALVGTKLIADLQEPYDAMKNILNRDLRQFDNVKIAEDAVKAIKEGIATSKDVIHTLRHLLKTTHPRSLVDTPDYDSTAAAAQYYPVMYFSSDDYRNETVMKGVHMWHSPTTCTADKDNTLQVVFGGTAGDCAHHCDDLVGKCVAFNYFDFNDGMCFLLHKMATVQHWTGCSQENPAPFDAQCFAKLQFFEGVGGIAPRKDRILEEAIGNRQGDGECAHCLEELLVSKRCYEYDDNKCGANKHDATFFNYNSGNDIHCDELMAENPAWCSWWTGRPNDSYPDGRWMPASRVCPQCGMCTDNKKAAGSEWPDKPYYYYYWYNYYD